MTENSLCLVSGLAVSIEFHQRDLASLASSSTVLAVLDHNDSA